MKTAKTVTPKQKDHHTLTYATGIVNDSQVIFNTASFCSTAQYLPMCGVMRQFYDDIVTLNKCDEIEYAFHYVCEFGSETGRQPRLQNSQALELSRIQLADLNNTDTLLFAMLNVSFVRCPGRHWTHEFLACDAQSDCWARTDAVVSGEWNAHASSWCDASMVSQFLSFVCDLAGQRVPFSLVCDSRADCVDASDENFCTYPPCPASKPMQCGVSWQVCFVFSAISLFFYVYIQSCPRPIPLNISISRETEADLCSGMLVLHNTIIHSCIHLICNSKPL